jgi:hypothetical protein
LNTHQEYHCAEDLQARDILECKGKISPVEGVEEEEEEEKNAEGFYAV